MAGLGLMFAVNGTALAGPTYGSVTGAFTPDTVRQGGNASFILTVKGDNQGQAPLPDNYFGVQYNTSMLRFIGTANNASCKAEQLPSGPYNAAMSCMEVGGADPKSDTFYFSVQPQAKVGQASVAYGALYGYAKGGGTAYFQVTAARSQCKDGDFNVHGFCVPNPAGDITSEVFQKQLLSHMTPRERALFLKKIAPRIIFGAYKGAKQLNFITALIQDFLANEGVAS